MLKSTTYKYSYLIKSSAVILLYIFSLNTNLNAQIKPKTKKTAGVELKKSEKSAGRLADKKEITDSILNSEISSVSSANKFLSTEEIEEYKAKIKHMISFLEFSLNTVGSDSSSVTEREIIINNSYKKVFRDENVLIEDDLDENRNAVTYKNVQAYLRDVHYFFKNVTIEFTIEDIIIGTNENNKTYFTAIILRNMRGVRIEGDTINTNKKRYIEINLNEEQKSLQIASIYSTKYNETSELQEWWKTLSESWKSILTKDFPIKDSINPADIKKITSIENIDISGNNQIVDLNPLDKFNKLKILNISGTGIRSLEPIRNLTKLETLIAEKTLITNLEPLKYCLSLKKISLAECPIENIDIIQNFSSLEELNINKTGIKSLDVLKNLPKIKYLECSYIKLSNIDVLHKLTSLVSLDISGNKITSLKALEELYELQNININNTSVLNLNSLKNLTKIKYLNFSNTKIKSLEPILNQEIQKIYCENSGISKEDAAHYINIHPSSLIICHSQGLLDWWNALDNNWKSIFKKYFAVSEIPKKEELATCINLTKINLNDNKDITDLSPLTELSNLYEVYLNNTNISSLEPLSLLNYLHIIEFSNTSVNNLSPLISMNHLRKINCNNTQINAEEINQFIEENPQILVIYKSEELISWWEMLTDDWKRIFKSMIRLDEQPNQEQLHKLVKLDSIYFSNTTVSSLEAITQFKQLEILRFSNTQISDLSPLKVLKNLKVLQCTHSPIKTLEPIADFTKLVYLDFSNTGVKELKPIVNLIYLHTLKCGGTQIKNIKNLVNLPFLNTLDISNTKISSLHPIKNRRSLKLLICFNTSLSERKIEKYKLSHPNTQIIFY